MKLPHFSSLRTKLPLKNPVVLLFAPLALLLFVAATVVVLTQATPSTEGGTNPMDAAAYQEQLRGQVDTETGAPRSGRDPASQSQGSLAAAASQPTGAGQRVDKPAAGVTGDHSHHTSSSDVYGDPSQTGIGSNGCYIDYGIQGEQCLPAHAATNGTLTCEGVHSHGFPKGIKVTGTDRFHLDTNHDGTACGSSD